MLRRLSCLFQYFFRRRELEDDLDEELRASFEITVERCVERGLAPAEARRAARLHFDGLDFVKESVRDGLIGSGVDATLQDLGYAWRGIRRAKSFATVSIGTLALGIGVNTAVFSMFYGLLLHPLPYRDPERLVLIWTSFKTAGTTRAPVSGAILGEIERRNRSLESVAGIWTLTRTFLGETPEQVKCARVTPNFFEVLGVRAAAGRTFVKEDAGGPAMLLSDGFYRRRFAANQALVGKGLPTLGNASTLMGVLPTDFQLHFAPDANVPADVQVFDTFGDYIYKGRDQYYIRLVGRLKPGVSMAASQADLARVATEIRGAYTEYARENMQFTVAGMQVDAVRDVQPALSALFAGSAFVLLICCVNVASLLLARATDRQPEIALRLALGASRGRIVRQLLTEGALLCLMGGAMGIGLGWGGYSGLVAIRPERLAQIGNTSLQWPVLVFALACSVAAALLFGLVPSIESFRLDLIAKLRTGDKGWLGRMPRRAGAMLVVAEVMLGFVLVAAAGLAARTLAKVQQAHPGFEPRQLLAFQVGGQIGQGSGAVREWEAQLAALPGVERVGGITHLPLDTDIPNWYGPYRPEGATKDDAETLVADLRAVTPGYFGAMDVRLLEGRFFDDDDRERSRPVVIVDDLLAHSTWPGQSAVGKKLEAEHATEEGFRTETAVVVGVVEHIQNHSLTRKVRGQIYMPFEQSPRNPVSFVVRSSVPPLTLVPKIRQVLRDRSKSAAMAKVRPMTEYVRREIAPVSFTAVLAAIFGSLALLLAAIGTYGVFHYQVSRRMPEIGVRMALGATSENVLGLVLGEGLRMTGAGVLLGVGGTLATAHWLRALLYGVEPVDPMSYGAALVLLPLAALLGCWRPAWRAAAADPAETMRAQ